MMQMNSTPAGFFEMIEKFYDPPGEEDLLHFLNRKYKELYDFESFGKTSTIDDADGDYSLSSGVPCLTPSEIPRRENGWIF